MARVTVYVPDSLLFKVQQFFKLYKAKSETGSAKLVNFMCKEVDRLNPNWQKRMTNYVQGMGVLCGCGQPAKYQANWKHQTADVCKSCLSDLKRKHGTVGWRRLKP